jgi:uncharacterized phage protein gp47/JayE
VRDVLTTLTAGVTGEVHRIPAYDTSARPVQVPDVTLQRRPVHRVSLVAGAVEAPNPEEEPIATVFSLDDYELVAAPDDPDGNGQSTIRFLPFGRKPAPESDLVVNYYPRNVDPSPITDVNVGSVARTLVEALARELAVVYAQLNEAYESGFVETATGSSLDRVVALLGLTRYRAGRPVGTVRFGRRQGSTGTIAIPPGTLLTDTEDTIRYETTEAHAMLAGESTAEVRVRGATAATLTVEPGVLTVVQRAIAGIDSVVNEQATSRATADELDEELRVRARSAVADANKGTLGALEHGLLQHPDVRAVSLLEFPNDVPGELRVSVSLADPSRESIPRSVLARIEELRPAGVRVVSATAGGVVLAASVALVLAGSHRTPSEIEEIHRGVRRSVAGLVTKAGVGQKVRVGPIVSAILGDERIVDAVLRLGPKGSLATAGADFQPPEGAIAELAEGDVAFEPDAFDQPVGAESAEVRVDVTAVVAAIPAAGVPIGEVQEKLEGRLGSWAAALGPGPVDATAVLEALRDDASYALDPLGLTVTLAFEDQFAQIAHGGPAFTVLPGHVFVVAGVEVTVPGGAA